MNNLQKQLQLKHLGYYLGISLIYPVAGYVLTGIICSRGANFINDLFKKVKGE